jgi:uncharacterized protein (TIRG00374 family)
MKNIKHIFILLKLLITGSLLYYFFHKSNFESLLIQIKSVDFFKGFFAFLILNIILIILGFRWWLITRILKIPIKLKSALYLSFIGHFFNQILPSSVGGDAVKLLILRKSKSSIGESFSSLASDRIIGLFSLLLLSFISLYFSKFNLENENHLDAKFLILLLIVGLILLLILNNEIINFLFKFKNTKPFIILLNDLKKIMLYQNKGLILILLSFLSQILTVFLVFILAKGINLQLDFISCITIIPIVLLISSIPISIAGWGVREGAMISGLSLFGISATQALNLSILFGILQLLGGVMGLIFWIFLKNARD